MMSTVLFLVYCELYTCRCHEKREKRLEEVSVLGQMKHPNIVAYRESFEGM